MRQTWAVIAFSFFAIAAAAQPLSFNFHRVTTAQGLNISNTTAITEDKYGYIWLGTIAGLHRYDGYKMKVYEHRFGDSTSLMPSAVRYAFCDAEGRLWVSFMNGLMEYDYARDCFKNINMGGAGWVTNIVEGKPKHLYIGTSNGLAKLNTATGTLTWFDSLNTGGRGWASQVFHIAPFQNELYLATRNGIVVFNPETDRYRQVELPEEFKKFYLNKLAISPDGEVWVGGIMEGDPVWRTNTRFDTWKKYTELSRTASGQVNRANHLFFDRQGRLWASSILEGIALYDPVLDKFRSAPVEPWMPNGLLTGFIGRMYQDRKGQIWAESTKGAAYFNPDNNFFQTISPGNRADADEGLQVNHVAERPDGQLWISTQNGIYLHNPATGQHVHYVNEPGKPPVLHHNAARTLCLDSRGDLWVGTTKGVNRLRAGSQRFEFLGEKEGLSAELAYSVAETRDGTIWVGDFTSAGHRYLPPGETKFRPLQEHPVLNPYARLYGHCILEDSRGLLWLGLDGRGLICYNPQAQTAQHWERSPKNDTTLVGNYVNALCEGPDGIIWAATSMGLSAIDPRTMRFTNYDRARGLPTNRVSSVLADEQNRLWLGTSQGLMLLDSTRQRVRQFDQNDGLPETEFVNLPPRRLSDGRFAFASRRGLVVFYPEAYSAQQPAELPLLLSEVRTLNQHFETPTNPEALSELYLPPGKNFFSLDITALNYANPRQTWYAYKMEPYDQDWTYSRDRTANYTNVPGGHYTFRYKATTDPNNWAVPEKSLRIRVGEHWYLARWFWGAIALLAAGFGITAFRRRAQLREAFLSLERKAQALAKEKAVVQYENLTQQLNPHFLFNSLASLGSLIRFDQKTASEFLEALSKMYRYILQSRDRETVPLHEEAAFAEHFLKLQKTRFGDALQVRFNIKADCRERKIVPVTMQNLLENALKHNTVDSDDPLVVDVFTEKNCLVVRTNVQRRAVVETSNKQGLARLQSLYQYLSDAPMTVEEAEGFFTVRIPLL